MSWQPIETAPRDGTEVDLWSPGCGRTVDSEWKEGRWRYWGPNEFGNNDWCWLKYPPTHWMPIPADPV